MSSKSRRKPTHIPFHEELEWLKQNLSSKQKNILNFVTLLVIRYKWHIVDQYRTTLDYTNPALFNQTHTVLRKGDMEIDVFNVNTDDSSINIKFPGHPFIETVQSINQAYAILSQKTIEFFSK